MVLVCTDGCVGMILTYVFRESRNLAVFYWRRKADTVSNSLGETRFSVQYTKMIEVTMTEIETSQI